MTAGPAPDPATLVGRERELATLREALAAALAGRGSLVLIGGEAGVGKTTLAEEVLAAAAAQGALVLLGRCYDLGETPPYGPWSEALENAPSGEALPTLPAAVLPPERSGEALVGQDAVIRRVRDYLAALADRQPLALLLDDVHWADPASLALLRFLGRQLAALPALILVAYRSDALTRHHPLYDLLPYLDHEARAVRLELRRFDVAGVRALVVANYPLPEADAARLVAWLHGRTDGNAFFTAQLLRALEDAGVLAHAGATWSLGDLGQVGLPAPLRQMLEARLTRLGEAALRHLTLAAVVGPEVPLAIWAAVAETDEDGLLDTIERGVEARLLVESPDGAAVRFAHALIREALYVGMIALRRRRVHLRVGEALAAALAPDPDAVAHHFGQAGDPRAYAWLVRAGERAARAYAWLTAAARYEAALALADQAGVGPADRATLLLTLAQCWRYEDSLRGVAYLEEAEELAETAGDAALLAAARFDRGHLRQLANDARAVAERSAGLAAMAAALPALEMLAPVDRARLPALRLQGVGGNERYHRGALLYWLVFVGRLGEALALAAPLVAREPGTPARGLAALGLAYHALGRPAEAERALAEAQAAFHAAGQQAEVIYRLSERLLVAWAYRLDQPAGWQPLVAELVEAIRRAADTWRTAPDMFLSWLSLTQGDWDRSRGEAAAGDWARATMARHQGYPAAAWAAVTRYLPLGPATEPGGHALLSAPPFQRLAVALATDAGALDTARDWLAAHDCWLAWSGAVLERAEGALSWAAYYRAVGDAPRARAHAEAALAHATAPRQPLALLAAHRFLGELTTASDDHAAARAHLDAALALADACAAPYERALTLLALAEVHAATGERERADTTLATARAILEPLEARPALARADALAARLAAPDLAPDALPFGLTAREGEVLALLVEGLTDVQIGERLYVSRNTINTHTRAIYGKLGVTSRAAATRIAIDHGLR